jgi:outer membrane protein assembly factor BamB
LGGAVGTVVLGKWAATLHRRLPHPDPADSPDAIEEQENRTGRWAVAAFGGLAVLATVGVYAGFRSSLPSDARQLAAWLDSDLTADPLVAPGLHAAPDDRTAIEPPIGIQPGAPAADRPAVADLPELAAGFPTEEALRVNWPRFRGWDGAGIVEAQVLTNWDIETGEGILWKTEVPLPGNSSPVVWEDRVFLTGADEQTREVFCFDAHSGDLLWRQPVPGTAESTAEVPKLMEATGYAAPTAATDGRRVYAIFANGDLGAFDFQGRLRWARSLGIPKNAYGHASSLALFQDRLIVQLDQGIRDEKLSRLLALDTATGDTVWEVMREVPNSWSSPIVIHVDGQPQIITATDPWVIANSPADGSEIWRANYLRGDIGPSPVFAGGMVFAANEFPGLVAIRADGRGDVTETHVAWEADLGAPDTASPLATDELVFLLASYGILTCYDARQGGDPLWEAEFDCSFVSSPTLIGDLVFLFGNEGEVYILRATADEGRVVAENHLGEPCVTSPAVVNGRILIRGKEHLICIGQNP